MKYCPKCSPLLCYCPTQEELTRLREENQRQAERIATLEHVRSILSDNADIALIDCELAAAVARKDA